MDDFDYFLEALEPRRIRPTWHDISSNEKAPTPHNTFLQLFTLQQQSLQHLQASAMHQKLKEVTPLSSMFAVTHDRTFSMQPLQGHDGQQVDHRQHTLIKFPGQTAQQNDLVLAWQRQQDLLQLQEKTITTLMMNLLTVHRSQYVSAPVQPFPISGQNTTAATISVARKSKPSPPTALEATSQGQGRPMMLLYMATDDYALSEYQILLRKNIEFVEASMEDVETTTPGRKKPITLGQVGIRCKHCVKVPVHWRSAATVYFPTKLHGLYQSAQSIGLTHLENTCEFIPPHLRARFKARRVNGKKAAAGHEGKLYWAHGATVAGVMETADMGLRFASELSGPAE
jgi:hypothetical protein